MVNEYIQCEVIKPKNVKIIDGYIFVDGIDDKFNPFDTLANGRNPLLEFASIDTNEIDQIARFVKEYGLLGISHNNELLIEKDINDIFDDFFKQQVMRVNQSTFIKEQFISDLHSLVKKIAPIATRRVIVQAEGTKLEQVNSFVKAVKIMACLFRLYDSRNYIDKERYIDELKRLLPEYTNEFKEIERAAFRENKREALHLGMVSFVVCENMRSVEFNTNLHYDSKAKKYVINAKYFVPTLLSGLYTMFYFHITKHGVIHQCPICKNYYSTNNSACSTECIRALSSKKYYWGKKTDPIYLEYEKIRKRMVARMKAKGSKRITRQEFDEWKKNADEALKVARTLEEFQEIMNEKKEEADDYGKASGKG